jgi:uncharacterized protein (DUF4415 family)
MPAKRAATKRKWVDPDDVPEWTDEMLERADLLDGDKVIRRGKGRPKLAATKVQVTLRLDGDVIERFRTGGRGWQSRINAALRKQLKLGARRVG